MAERDIPIDIAKLYTIVERKSAEFEAAIKHLEDHLGVNENVGVRGEIAVLKDQFHELRDALHQLEAWGKDKVNELWDRRRPAECIGKKAVEDLIKSLEEKELDDMDVKKFQASMAVQKRNSYLSLVGVFITGAFLVVSTIVAKGGTP